MQRGPQLVGIARATLVFEPAPSDDERVEVWVRRGQVCREVVAAHSSDTDTEARRRSSLAAEILIHPTRMFGSRLIGATDTLSSTYDTLDAFSRPQRAVLHGGLNMCWTQATLSGRRRRATATPRHEFRR